MGNVAAMAAVEVHADGNENPFPRDLAEKRDRYRDRYRDRNRYRNRCASAPRRSRAADAPASLRFAAARPPSRDRGLRRNPLRVQ